MPKRYTAGELVKIVKKDGWFFVKQEGSHAKYHHQAKKGSVTIPIHKGTIKPMVANSILKQAGLK